TEDSPAAPPALTAWRLPVEDAVLSAPGLAATLIQPGIVHGHGAGIPGDVIAGQNRLVGDGSQHWTTVHVDDIAALYALVVTQGAGLGRVIGVSGVNPTVRELVSAVSADVVAESPEQTRARLGDGFGGALLLDQQATGAKARSLGWKPAAPTLLEELTDGSYA
ncbi:NAD-dependent dehydratase, partial [Actinoplanes sp. NPDC051633]